MQFREITETDLPSLFDVRIATRENNLSCVQLASMGITEASVAAMLHTSHRGWLCEINGRTVGFAMGNRENGEMWVIAILPEYEGKGIGSTLLLKVEEWLWSEGWQSIWLTTDTDPSLRAYGFYTRHGWIDHKIEHGLRYMHKTRPDSVTGSS